MLVRFSLSLRSLRSLRSLHCVTDVPFAVQRLKLYFA